MIINDKPYWAKDGKWVCQKHLPSARIPAKIGVCWFANCSSVRPRKPDFDIVITEPPFCAFEKCKEDKRSNSKYCSDSCRKKQARLNYRRRKENEKKSKRCA